ncbi:MAG: pirin family protein [Thermoleophilia bacterium]
MNSSREINRIFSSRATLEGAGVHLKRAFGFGETPLFDPFLMLDDFRSDNPEHYLKGFPWHPHRGIETITYVLQGDVEHSDSMGNRGVISSGDVQWMTAGSGIIHQEMPRGDAGGVMQGFQLWANLPAREKMRDPRYRDVKAGQIPVVELEDGVQARVICGVVGNTQGPVRDIVTDPQYLDVTVPAHSRFEHATVPGHTVLAYVIDGQGFFDERRTTAIGDGELVLFGAGDRVVVSAENEPVRFLLLSGQPIGEPVAWQGPIVMNTREKLRTAFEEYDKGTFIKHRAA